MHFKNPTIKNVGKNIESAIKYYTAGERRHHLDEPEASATDTSAPWARMMARHSA